MFHDYCGFIAFCKKTAFGFIAFCKKTKLSKLNLISKSKKNDARIFKSYLLVFNACPTNPRKWNIEIKMAVTDFMDTCRKTDFGFVAFCKKTENWN